MRCPDPISKQKLLETIHEDPLLHIVEEHEDGLVLWDDENAKCIPVHFHEQMSPNSLEALIRISDSIPKRYAVDKGKLAEYLWNHADRNAFTTLEALVLVWSEPDENKEGEEDELRRQLCEEYNDEYALEIADGYLGQLWFERNIAVVNIGMNARAALEVEQENRDIADIDPFFSWEYQYQMGVLTTVLHELRHLQMDTNVFLSEEDYPLVLNSEEEVEEYCRRVFEETGIPLQLFPSIYS